MKCLGVVIESNGNKALIELNGKSVKVGTTVTVKWGKARSVSQNRLYWLFLTYLIEEGGMKDQGYMFPEELHEALKGRLLSRKVKSKAGFEAIYIKSTTTLTADEFMDYITKAEHLLRDYCGVDTTPFWQRYGENYGGK